MYRVIHSIPVCHIIITYIPLCYIVSSVYAAFKNFATYAAPKLFLFQRSDGINLLVQFIHIDCQQILCLAFFSKLIEFPEKYIFIDSLLLTITNIKSFSTIYKKIILMFIPSVLFVQMALYQTELCCNFFKIIIVEQFGNLRTLCAYYI